MANEDDVIFIVRAILLLKAVAKKDVGIEAGGGYFRCFYCAALEDEPHAEKCLHVRIKDFVEEFENE